MAEQLEIEDLVAVAVEDERSGVAFYSTLAQNASDADLRKSFADLAEQERFHLQRFSDMLADLRTTRQAGVSEEYPGQYAAYLSALTSDRAFPDAEAARRQAADCPCDAEALDLAIRFERDTLMLMNELRTLVPDKDVRIVVELAAEEQEHLVRLTQARRRLG